MDLRYKIVLISLVLVSVLFLSVPGSAQVDNPIGLEPQVDSHVVESVNNGEEKIGVIVKLNEEIEDRGEFFTQSLEIAEEKKGHTYSSFNGFSAELSSEEVERLKNSEHVESIGYNHRVTTHLDESTELINATESWNLQPDGTNMTGEDQTVCVIDTGVDYYHEALGGGWGEKVVAGYNAIEGKECDDDDEDPDPCMDLDGHGTHVAGISAADSDEIQGVAPDSNIAAVKALGDDGDVEDVVAGIEWCTNNSDDLNISAITMSLGWVDEDGDEILYDTYCDIERYNYLATTINQAISENITVSVATGNEGNNTHIGVPACIENATRVGATNYDDEIAEWNSDGSNRWDKDMLVAPGTDILSTYTGDALVEANGTSMAAPHVSGAVAIMNQYLDIKGEEASKDEIESYLEETGVDVEEEVNSDGRTYPRIDVHSTLIEMDNGKFLVDLVDLVDIGYEGEEPADVVRGEVVDVEFELENIGEFEYTQNITFNVTNETGSVYDDTVEGTLEGGESEHYDYFEWDTNDVETGEYDLNVSSEDDYDIVTVDVSDRDLTVNVSGEGNVSINGTEYNEFPQTMTFENGTDVDLVALPADDWTFDKWSGDNEEVEDKSEEETNVTMLGDYNITAEFYEDVLINTKAVENITNESATLVGNVSDISDDGELDVFFEYRKEDESEWNQTDNITKGTEGEFNETITGLEQFETYEYRAVGEFENGRDQGNVASFDTLGFAAGKGTEEEPYYIETWDQLDNLRNYTDSNFILNNSLDNETSGYEDAHDEEKGFDPIGDFNEGSLFNGTFNGSGYSINELYIEREEEFVALFRILGENAQVKDLGLNNVNITGYKESEEEGTGVLVGSNSGLIENVYTTGKVEGVDVGGLVGANIGNIKSSVSKVDVLGNEGVLAGGLVAYNAGNISDSYSAADVQGDISGGLIGFNKGNDSYVNRTYSVGYVEGERVGGAVGNHSSGTLNHTYWNNMTSGTSEAMGVIGENASYNVSGLLTEQMLGENASENMFGYDFEEVWNVTEKNGEYFDAGYPHLDWQEDEYVYPRPEPIVYRVNEQPVNYSSTEITGNLTHIGALDSVNITYWYDDDDGDGWESTIVDEVNDIGTFEYNLSSLELGTYDYYINVSGNYDDQVFSNTSETGSFSIEEPSVSTSGTDDINYHDAEIEVELESIGLEDEVNVSLRYRESDEDGWNQTEPEGKSDEGEFDIDLDDLDAGTTYEYKTVVEWYDSDGEVVESNGTVLNFDTYSYPSVETEEASDIDEDSATLNSYIEHAGVEDDDSLIYFRYGTDEDDLDSETDEETDLESDSDFSYELDDLDPDTEYYYEAVIEWYETLDPEQDENVSEGGVESFVTDEEDEDEDEDDDEDDDDDDNGLPSIGPYVSVDTLEVEDIDYDTATLVGEVTDLDDVEEVNVYFRYREEDDDEWDSSSGENLDDEDVFEQTVYNLDYDTDYEYKAVAEWENDTATGDIEEFSTIRLAPSIDDPEPEDGAIDLDTDVTLSVELIHAHDDEMDVTFIDAGDNSIIDQFDDVEDEVSTTWSDLDYGTSYEWYVEVNDGYETVTSDTWEFDTIAEDDLTALEDDIENKSDDLELISQSDTVAEEDVSELNDLYEEAQNALAEGDYATAREKMNQFETLKSDLEDIEETEESSIYMYLVIVFLIFLLAAGGFLFYKYHGFIMNNTSSPNYEKQFDRIYDKVRAAILDEEVERPGRLYRLLEDAKICLDDGDIEEYKEYMQKVKDTLGNQGNEIFDEL